MADDFLIVAVIVGTVLVSAGRVRWLLILFGLWAVAIIVTALPGLERIQADRAAVLGGTVLWLGVGLSILYRSRNFDDTAHSNDQLLRG